MAWAEIRIGVSREDTTVAEEALEALGALAITLEDDADNPVLEPDPGATPLWPTVQVRGLFEAGVDRDVVVAGLQSVPGADRPQNLRWRDVGDQDWERAWLDRFEPMQFGRHVWIVPTGMSLPDDAHHDEEIVEIRLDPGLAFGTGTHPTTALCLEWIDGHDFEGTTVVDYGCGSGILAIAAALKGARKVLCVDTDPQALLATGENSRRNAISERVETFLPDEFPAGAPASDVVLANILAGPLIERAPVISGLTRPGGHIVLSGILQEQAEDVAEAWSPFAETTRRTGQDGWVRLDLVRKSGRPPPGGAEP
jgi:ribosomal protein L11 methyltransferase